MSFCYGTIGFQYNGNGIFENDVAVESNGKYFIIGIYVAGYTASEVHIRCCRCDLELFQNSEKNIHVAFIRRYNERVLTCCKIFPFTVHGQYIIFYRSRKRLSFGYDTIGFQYNGNGIVGNDVPVESNGKYFIIGIYIGGYPASEIHIRCCRCDLELFQNSEKNIHVAFIRRYNERVLTCCKIFPFTVHGQYIIFYRSRKRLSFGYDTIGFQYNGNGIVGNDVPVESNGKYFIIGIYIGGYTASEVHNRSRRYDCEIGQNGGNTEIFPVNLGFIIFYRFFGYIYFTGSGDFCESRALTSWRRNIITVYLFKSGTSVKNVSSYRSYRFSYFYRFQSGTAI